MQLLLPSTMPLPGDQKLAAAGWKPGGTAGACPWSGVNAAPAVTVPDELPQVIIWRPVHTAAGPARPGTGAPGRASHRLAAGS